MSTLLLLIAGLLLHSPAVQSRTGVIAGQILSQNGVPAADVRVMAIEASADSGVGVSLSLAQTDRLGRYRLDGIPPGRYHIIAGVLDSPVYFPGVVLASRATSVDVAAGSTTKGVDFTLVRNAFTVGGHVTWETGPRPSSAKLTLAGNRRFEATVGSDGVFEISNVLAGSYSLDLTETVAAGGRGQQRNVTRPAPVFPQRIVVGEDNTRTDFRVPNTREYIGAVAVEGGGPAPRFELLLNGRFPISVAVDRGGFRAPLPPGQYRVSAKDLPSGFTLKSVSVGGRSEWTDSLTLTLPDVASSVNVTLAPVSPDSFGKVVGHIAGVSAASGLSVILRETLPATAGSSGRNIAPNAWAAPVSATGDFEFPRVLSGKYRATLSAGQETRLDLTTVAPVDVVVEASANRAGSVKSLLMEVPVQKEIRGRIQVRGRGPIPTFSVVTSTREDEDPHKTYVRPDAEGRFTVTVAVGEHMVDDIEDLPSGYEFVSAQYGSNELSDEPLHIAANDTSEFRVRLTAPTPSPASMRVSGRAINAAPEAVARGLRATLTSTAYAGSIETDVKSDGSFTFPEVFPGVYTVRIAGAGADSNMCAPVVVGQAGVNDVLVSPAKEFAILSAIYGGSKGSADVTPIVTSLTRPELDEFFAAPAWLLVDPAFGQIKQLVVSYQFRCREFRLTTREPAAISHAILTEYAKGILAGELWNGPVVDASESMVQSMTPVSFKDVVILSASYGTGGRYSSVTPRVRELLGSGAPFFTVTDSTFDVNQDNNQRDLVLMYLYQGKRGALAVGKGRELSLALLAETVRTGVQANAYLSEAPPWLKDAQPDPPLEPGVPGAGIGQAPRMELGIMSLLKALAELQELLPKGERKAAIAVPTIKQAISDAQLNVRYAFPPASSKPVAPGPNAASDARLRSAVKNLNEAKTHLGAANGGFNAAALSRSLAAIDQVLATLK